MTSPDTYWALWAILTTPSITAAIVIMGLVTLAAVLLVEWSEDV